VFERTPEILDVTLRDGSYLIDFQFTAADTARIAVALEAVGVRWIEIGHGLGLNASACGRGQAAATDEEYMDAAASTLTQARWGMFCIPGIARLEDVRRAGERGMPFVRVGTDITRIDEARPYVELAKTLGCFVSYNAMKSYAVSPSEFGRRAAAARSFGVDLVCLVDSAGGMFPDDVAAYLDAARSESDVWLGFHGHDNLAMAMANSLRASDHGAVLIDTSLQGMGRSAGNAVTEALVAILRQRGQIDGVDLNGVMDVGQGLIRPLMQGHVPDPMAITAGYARFHSSFAAKVKAYAAKYGLDVRDLIVRLTQEDMVGAPDALLDRIGQELAAAGMPQVVAIPAFRPGGGHHATGLDGLRVLLKELRVQAAKAAKSSVLNIATGEAPMPKIAISANIHNTPAHVVGSVTLTSAEQLTEVLRAADRHVDVILRDVDRKPFGAQSPARLARECLECTELLTYFASRVWVSAVEDQCVRLLSEDLDDQVVVIVGDHTKSRFLASFLAERLATVVLLTELQDAFDLPTDETFPIDLLKLGVTILRVDEAEAGDWMNRAGLVVAWSTGPSTFDVALARCLPRDVFLVDARIGSLTSEAVAEARRRGVQLARVNIWPALAGTLESAHESARVRREAFGWGQLGGVTIVAGGAMGDAGDVVVDSVTAPTRVIGVADGLGGVRFGDDTENERRVSRVTEEIQRRQISPGL